MEFAHKLAPDDLKRLHKKMEYNDPRSTTSRKSMPLDANTYKLNPLAKPDGYPWHRWTKPAGGSYALNSTKFVSILSRLGNGEDSLGTVTPNNYTVGGVELAPDTVRLGTKVRPYIIKDGTVLRPGGRTGMFVTLVQRAVEMASSHAAESPRLKTLTEGEIPLVFDANDYSSSSASGGTATGTSRWPKARRPVLQHQPRARGAGLCGAGLSPGFGFPRDGCLRSRI